MAKIVEDLTFEEKIRSIVNMLNTPIYRRRINNDVINKLITDVYFEMKARDEASN